MEHFLQIQRKYLHRVPEHIMSHPQLSRERELCSLIQVAFSQNAPHLLQRSALLCTPPPPRTLKRAPDLRIVERGPSSRRDTIIDALFGAAPQRAGHSHIRRRCYFSRRYALGSFVCLDAFARSSGKVSF